MAPQKREQTGTPSISDVTAPTSDEDNLKQAAIEASWNVPFGGLDRTPVALDEHEEVAEEGQHELIVDRDVHWDDIRPDRHNDDDDHEGDAKLGALLAETVERQGWWGHGPAQ